MKCSSGYSSPFSFLEGKNAAFYSWILYILLCISPLLMFVTVPQSDIACFMLVLWVWIPRAVSPLGFLSGWWGSSWSLQHALKRQCCEKLLLASNRTSSSKVVTEPILLTLFVFLWQSTHILIILLWLHGAISLFIMCHCQLKDLWH